MKPPATEAGRATLALADLAAAARSGPVGPATVLSYVARLQRHLDYLADYEDAADSMAEEDRQREWRRHEAIQSGEAVPFPARPRIYTGHGGTAA